MAAASARQGDWWRLHIDDLDAYSATPVHELQRSAFESYWATTY